jgi:hypothetical protein
MHHGDTENTELEYKISVFSVTRRRVPAVVSYLLK